ncbi:MAG: hypothetical protein KC416_05725 [Myxococcales bacterium]|nr:hypothetical protein [Myxococcales bacterium]
MTLRDSHALQQRCIDVLKGNDRGNYTIPSPRLYPHQWAWDSAFAAIGWAHIDPNRAWIEIETLMNGQWKDGRIPHIFFHHKSNEYFPGPEFWEVDWEAGQSTSITQPPVWATAARRLFEITGDRDRLAPLLPKMDASHRFFFEQRDPKRVGCVAVVHPWESGLDNCPVWDGPLSRVDISNPPEFKRVDADIVEDASVRPSDDEYVRYACLVKAIAKDNFGPGPFAVYDPMMTALLARAERDLAWCAKELGHASEAEERSQALAHGLEATLWSEEHGRFLYWDPNADERITVDVVGGYLPLWCNIAEEKKARLKEGLRERYATKYQVPTTATTDAAYKPRLYWRGPVWVNVNWMLVETFGRQLAEQTLELVEQGGIREYFHPETAEGLGGEEFAWTAALTLDLLSRFG